MALRKKNKVNNIHATLMLSVAVLIDAALFVVGLLNFIPLVGIPLSAFIGFMINFYAYLIFITWFFLLGVSLLRRGRLAISATAFIIGFIPIINMLPAWTVSVGIMIITTRYRKKKRVRTAMAGTVSSR